MSLYSAKSLADIAVHFERMAVNCDKRAKSAAREWVRKEFLAQARTWREAAQIILQTEIRDA